MPAALLALLAALQTPAAPDTTRLVILATTDVHGRMLGWDYVRDAEAPGGLSRAATIIETLRARFPDRVVLLDAGDLLQGNPFATYFAREDARRPHPIIDALNALGYDAATPGNHDFDFGLDVLRRAAGDASFRYVSGNIRISARSASGIQVDTLLFPSHVVLTRGDVRVGVTGFTTPGVMVWGRAGLQAGRVRVLPIATAAPAALRAVAAAGADLRIAVVHSGLAGGSSYDTTGIGPENAAAVLAAVDPKPHLVIVGHTHREIRDTVIDGVHFVQPGNWARSLSVVHVTLVSDGTEGRRYRVVEIRPDLIPLASVAEVPRIVRRLATAHGLARTWAGQPLGVAGPGFEARYARVQDTPLLDFVNEVQRRRTGAQLSATAAFDVAAGFREGEVRLGDVAGVYPYENTLRVVRVSGAQLRAFLEHSARYFRQWQPGGPIIDPRVPGYNFDVVHGAEYVIDVSRPAGERIGGLRVGGRPVAPGDSFTLALNSYRQEGGGGYAMLRGAPVVYDRGENVRDLITDEIRRLGALEAGAFYRPSWSLAPAEAREAARQAFAPAPPPVSTADSTLLRVLAITDFHGALAPRTWGWSEGRLVGGAAALRPWLDSLARDCGCSAVRLDAGDEMTGTPLSNFTWGRATIDALSRLGIDAAAVGNHEFDWTVDTLRARIAEARYPFLSANLTDTAGVRPPWVEPFTVISRGAMKVAVIGLTTTETPTATRPDNVRGLRFGDPAAAIRAVLPQARAAADLVVVLAHEGAQCDSAGCRGPVIDIARQLDSGSVDLIVAGHHHRIFTTRVNGIPIMQAGSSGNTIALADFVRVGGSHVEVRTRLVTPYADAVRADTGLARLVDGLERRFAEITARPVRRLAGPLHRTHGEHALGRLIADAQRNAARADVAIMNNGGIRTDLPAGTVTYGDLLLLQPFANRVLRISLTGAQLLAALEHVVADSTPAAHVSGVELWYDPGRRPGRRITRTRLSNGRSVERGRRYTLAVNDFMATGGSGFEMLRDLPREDTGLADVDALARYLAALREPVTAPAGRRLHRRGE
jgi:2',3'-cyclic-nucleotide 2'-phosphodiesterase (5'-nucleotidase family)